jgi:hypothetical protein
MGVIDSHGGCCRLLGFSVGIVRIFLLLSSLLKEFTNGQSCSNFSLAVSSLAVLSSHVASLCTFHAGRYTAAFLPEAGGDSSLCSPCFEQSQSISDFC